MTSQLPTILLASVVTLGLVVIVHELGHFLFCKMFGIYVKTFSIGMGPKLVRWRMGETEYVLSAVPFGGYVKMAGEGMMEEIQDTGTWEERKYPLGTLEGNREAATLDEDIPRDRLFSERPVWQRLLVFIAGPLFNLLLAWIIYTSLFAFEGLRSDPFTRVGEVRDGTPAAVAGFAVGDSILAVDGRPVADWDDVMQGMVPEASRAGRSTPAVSVAVARGEQRLDLQLTPEFDDERGHVDRGPRDLEHHRGPGAEGRTGRAGGPAGRGRDPERGRAAGHLVRGHRGDHQRQAGRGGRGALAPRATRCSAAW